MLIWKKEKVTSSAHADYRTNSLFAMDRIPEQNLRPNVLPQKKQQKHGYANANIQRDNPSATGHIQNYKNKNAPDKTGAH